MRLAAVWHTAEGAHPQTLRQTDRPRRKARPQAAFRTLESGSSPPPVRIANAPLGRLPTEGARVRPGNGTRPRQRNLSGTEDRGDIHRSRPQQRARRSAWPFFVFANL